MFGVLKHFVHDCQVRGCKKIGEMGISWICHEMWS